MAIALPHVQSTGHAQPARLIAGARAERGARPKSAVPIDGRTRLLPALLPALLLVVLLLAGCSSNPQAPDDGFDGPPHVERWGIYVFDPWTGDVDLIYSTNNPLHRIDLSSDGSALVFREDFGLDPFTDAEICLIRVDGTGYERLTYNSWLDAYPCWSPDDDEILFLSWPDYPSYTMDIYLMDAFTLDVQLLYDSGYHDGDCAWEDSLIVFTRESQIWIMNDDGTDARQVTDYVLAGQQGAADLPFGDYDPRLQPAAGSGPGGRLISFDRMVDDLVPSGNFDFFTITADGAGEQQITYTGYSQFIAEWSNAGDRLVFTVAAVDGQGRYDLYMVNPNGTGYQNITPSDWSAEFLCSHPIFSRDDSFIYFVGQWFE